MEGYAEEKAPNNESSSSGRSGGAAALGAEYTCKDTEVR